MRNHRKAALVVLIAAALLGSGCGTGDDNDSSNDPRRPVITGALLDPEHDQLVLYGSFTANAGPSELVVRLQGSSDAGSFLELNATVTGPGQLRVELPRSAAGRLVLVDTDLGLESDPIHLTSWSGPVIVRNDYTVAAPSTSTQAQTGTWNLHMRGIIDAQLSPKTVAVVWDTPVTVGAEGILTDPEAGRTASWTLNGSPNVPFGPISDARYQFVNAQAVETNGRVTRLLVSATAYIPDGLRITTTPGGVTIAPLTLQAPQFQMDLTSDYRILASIELVSGTSSVRRTAQWGDLTTSYAP